MTNHRTDQIRGSLVDEQGNSSDVLLDLKIAQLRDDHGVVDEAIAEVSITFGVRTPADGVYTLHYVFHNRPHQERVQIKGQRMIGGFPS